MEGPTSHNEAEDEGRDWRDKTEDGDEGIEECEDGQDGDGDGASGTRRKDGLWRGLRLPVGGLGVGGLEGGGEREICWICGSCWSTRGRATVKSLRGLKGGGWGAGRRAGAPTCGTG